MKKVLIGVLAATLVAGMSAMVLAGTAPGTGITGSKHDFSDNTAKHAWNDRQEICRVCHIPHDHGVNKYYDAGLLWNRPVSKANYTMYSSDTMSQTAGQPTGSSKLCLSCHDGSVALDTFDKYNTTDNNIEQYGAGKQIPGPQTAGQKDMRGTHPVSIVYPPTATTSRRYLQYTSNASWAGGGTIADTLEAGLIQCATCHDVHNQEVQSTSGGAGNLLRTGQTVAKGGTASGLCLTCHIK